MLPVVERGKTRSQTSSGESSVSEARIRRELRIRTQFDYRVNIHDRWVIGSISN